MKNGKKKTKNKRRKDTLDDTMKMYTWLPSLFSGSDVKTIKRLQKRGAAALA